MSIEPEWRPLCRIGGAAAIAVLALVPFQIAVFAIWPLPETTAAWFAMFAERPVIALLDMDLLLLVDQLLITVMFLALYVALRRTSASLMAIALVLSVVALATLIASNPGFEMLQLAGRHAAAPEAADRAHLLAAGDAALASWTGTAFNASYVLGALASVIAAALMLRSPHFSRATGWIGLVFALPNLIPATAGAIGLWISLVTLIPMWIWLALIARRLLQLGAPGERRARRPPRPCRRARDGDRSRLRRRAPRRGVPGALRRQLRRERRRRDRDDRRARLGARARRPRRVGGVEPARPRDGDPRDRRAASPRPERCPMTLLPTFLPAPRVRQLDRVAVAAPPDEAWRAVRNLDLYDLDLARWLFALRIAPERALARLRGRPVPPSRRARIEDITAPGSGFAVLAETPGEELVIGATGRFWEPAITWRPVPANGFAAFDEPGWGQVAWNLRVDPRRAGGSWIACEVRVRTTDDASWRRFRRYWRLIGPFSHAIRAAFLRRMVRRLGAAPDARRALPGDELLAAARFERTHRAVIDAPPAALWPWLVQLGGGRAGWYSIDRLDNAGIPSADRIIPELQRLAPGDVIPGRPGETGGFAVLALDPARALVLGSPSLVAGGGAAGEPFYRVTWAFVLDPVGDDATELLVRVRAAFAPSWKATAASVVLGIEHEIMERVQLRNLARRAAGAVA